MTIFLLRKIKSFLFIFCISVFWFSYVAEAMAQSIIPPQRKLVKVLSIDGGGVVGIIPAMLLAGLKKNLNEGKILPPVLI